MVRIALAAAGVMLAAPAGATDIALQPGETLLEVKATGESWFLPDRAVLTLGVVSTGQTAREATDANAREMAAVVAAVRKTGVEARHVRTQQINVQPRFARGGPADYEGQPQITGYIARNSVIVTVGKLAVAPDVIASAFAAGANSVFGPNLGSDDPAAGLAEARANAVASARAQADAYAKSFGMRIARTLRISERGTSASPVEYGVLSRVSGPPPPPPPAPPQVSPPIAGGEMRRTVDLWVDFALTK